MRGAVDTRGATARPSSLNGSFLEARKARVDRGRVETPAADTTVVISGRDRSGPRHCQTCRASAVEGGLSPYALIASITGVVPRVLIARFKLYASSCQLISVPTRGSVRVRKWFDPIQVLSVPKTCILAGVDGLQSRVARWADAAAQAPGLMGRKRADVHGPFRQAINGPGHS